MSYTNESDNLNKEEVYDYLNLNKPLTEIIKKAWKDGYEWGYERGFEDGSDIYE